MNNAGFCRSCVRFRARAIGVGVSNIEVWRACETCVARPPAGSRKNWSFHVCAFHSLPAYRGAVLRRRARNKALGDAWRSIRRAQAAAFCGGGGAL